MFILGNGGIDDGACIVEMFQLKIIPLFSCFERVTCFFIYFYSYVVKLMVPIFLVHIWNDLPRPLKSQEEGTRNAFWVIRPPFCLFWTQWLATATWLAVPQAAQQQQTPKKFTQDYLSHFILPYFYAVFHLQLQRVPEQPLFMTTILLKDCSLRLLATQRLAQGRHPYYASCIVSISSVFFGAGIKLLQILLVPVIHGISLGIKLLQILLVPVIHGISLGIKLLQISLVPVVHGITLASLTLILKVTSTEKYDVRRLKPFWESL